MNNRIAVAIAICLFVFACSESRVSAPPRPKIVPTTALWAGGADGGVWLDCSALKRTRNRYRCTAYNDHNGSVWAEGVYVLSQSHWNEAQKKASYEPVSSRPSTLEYSAFDGEIIQLADSLVLIPDGWIKYPFETGGKKQFFKMGEHRGDEVQFK